MVPLLGPPLGGGPIHLEVGVLVDLESLYHYVMASIAGVCLGITLYCTYRVLRKPDVDLIHVEYRRYHRDVNAALWEVMNDYKKPRCWEMENPYESVDELFTIRVGKAPVIGIRKARR